MEKSPAFQFYPKDFLVDTAHLSNEEVGAYIKLVCFAWVGVQGCKQTELPNDRSIIARMVNLFGDDLEKKIDAVLSLFLPGDDGKVYHKRLKKELRKQLRHRRQKSKAGKASGKARQRKANERSTDVQRGGNPSSSSSSASSTSSPEEEGDPSPPPPAPNDTIEQTLLTAARSNKIISSPDTIRRHIQGWRARGVNASQIEAAFLDPASAGRNIFEVHDRFFKDNGLKPDVPAACRPYKPRKERRDA